MGEVYYDKICEILDKDLSLRGKTLIVYAPLGASSKISGQNRRNKIRICKKYGFNHIKILEKSEIIGYNIRIDTLA